MQKNQIFIRAAFYVIGISILTLGIALTIIVNLGASPIDALLVGLHQNFGLTVGSWEYIIAIFLLFINSLLNQKKPQILALTTAFLVGMGIDFWLNIFNPPNIFNALWINIPMLLFGTVLCSLGIATYLQAEFLPSPFDGTMLAISNRFKIKMFWAKTILMSIFLLLAFIFNGPIAAGTIVILILSGPVIGWFYPKMEALKIKTMEVI